MYLCALLPPDNLRSALFALQTRLFREFGLTTARLLPPLVPVARIDEPLSRHELLKIKQRLTPPRLHIGRCVWRHTVLAAQITPCKWLREVHAALAACNIGQSSAQLSDHRAAGPESALVPELCGFYVAWLPDKRKQPLRDEIEQWIAHYDNRRYDNRLILRVYRLASLRLEPLRLESPVAEDGLSLRVESEVWLKAR